MVKKETKQYYCSIASFQLWLLVLLSLCHSPASCEDGSSRSPNGDHTVKWYQDAANDYHLTNEGRDGQQREIKMLELEFRREDLGIANYDQRKFTWYFDHFLYSEWDITNENGHGGSRLGGIGVLDAKTNVLILNHCINGVGKDRTAPRWCFVKYRARSQRTAWDPFEDPDQLGLLSFEKNVAKPDDGECRVNWKKLDGLVAAQPQFSKDGKKIGVLIAKRLQPFCYIVSSTDLKTISVVPLKGLKLERRYLTEVVGGKYSSFLERILKDDYGF